MKVKVIVHYDGEGWSIRNLRQMAASTRAENNACVLLLSSFVCKYSSGSQSRNDVIQSGWIFSYQLTKLRQFPRDPPLRSFKLTINTIRYNSWVAHQDLDKNTKERTQYIWNFKNSLWEFFLSKNYPCALSWGMELPDHICESWDT